MLIHNYSRLICCGAGQAQTTVEESQSAAAGSRKLQRRTSLSAAIMTTYLAIYLSAMRLSIAELLPAYILMALRCLFTCSDRRVFYLFEDWLG